MCRTNYSSCLEGKGFAQQPHLPQSENIMKDCGGLAGGGSSSRQESQEPQQQQAAAVPAAAAPTMDVIGGDSHLNVVFLVVILLAWLAQWTLPSCTC